MRLTHVALPAVHIEQSRSFFEALGFTTLTTQEGYARLRCPDGEGTVSLLQTSARAGESSMVYFECRSPEQIASRLVEAGAAATTEVVTQPWKWRELRVQDPAGNQICFFDPGPWRLDPFAASAVPATTHGRAPIDPARFERVFGPQLHLPGKLIAVVGFDASGKTTQIEALAQRYRHAGHEVVETRQPTDWYRNESTVQHFHDAGGSRDRARILALVAAADRHRHVQEVILPAMARGAVVICDRYVYATFGVFLHRGVDYEFIATINQGVPRPDHAFYLDVPVPTLIERLHVRDGAALKFEERAPERIASIVSAYHEMGHHLLHIDGARVRDEITDDLWRLT